MNEYSEMNVEGIYAVKDVTGKCGGEGQVKTGSKRAAEGINRRQAPDPRQGRDNLLLILLAVID